jgi:hypothetical protein
MGQILASAETDDEAEAYAYYLANSLRTHIANLQITPKVLEDPDDHHHQVNPPSSGIQPVTNQGRGHSDSGHSHIGNRDRENPNDANPNDENPNSQNCDRENADAGPRPPRPPRPRRGPRPGRSVTTGDTPWIRAFTELGWTQFDGKQPDQPKIVGGQDLGFKYFDKPDRMAITSTVGQNRLTEIQSNLKSALIDLV